MTSFCADWDSCCNCKPATMDATSIRAGRCCRLANKNNTLRLPASGSSWSRSLYTRQSPCLKQESRAVAKMTARCAIYMYGCPENFRESLTKLCPRLLFPKFLMGFCCELAIEPINVRAKFEYHSFSRSWDNRGLGYPKKNWAVPGYVHAPLSPKFLMGFYSDGPSECTGQIWNP